MTRSSVPLSRLAALSVAITLFAASIASAQTINASTPATAPAAPVLLSPAAFARLIHRARPGVAPAPVVKDSPRPSLLRQGSAAMARAAHAAPAKAGPPQGSWVSRHKWVYLAPIIFFGSIIGLYLLGSYLSE